VPKFAGERGSEHACSAFTRPLYNRYVSTGGPDLFVICKSCGSEVSPYITECPYCGNRLRKRAPKIDREGRVSDKRRRRRPPAPSLPRLRSGEIPGIRAEAHPYATLTLVLLGLIGCLVWRTALVGINQIAIAGPPGSHWWRIVTAMFTYDNSGYAFLALGAIALYGWLIERRHGPIVVIALALIGGVGGIAATVAAYQFPVVIGGSGAALALLVAWAIPDLLAMRAGEEIEGDLLGTLVIFVVLLLIPVAVTDASWVEAGVGVIAGVAVGLPLARLRSS
jgi:membrane associated rhomboid family serine protease